MPELIPKAQVMSDMVEPFTVTGRITGETYKVYFSHLWIGMTTRHADTIDCKFLVNGRGIVIGLDHKGFVLFEESAGRTLTDQEAAHIAALFLRDFLEQEFTLPARPVDVPADKVIALATRLGLL